MASKKWTLLLLCLSLPFFASANILINEVAWMGTEASANDEWIELYNSGSDTVDLSGWALEAVDGSPAISLSGQISAGGFFLLERTDDASVTGISANQIYTGSLSNEGEILKLFNDSGNEVDSVDGSGAWAIGGDAPSRKTLQRSSSGWITADATPGATNASSSDDSTDNDDAGDQEEDGGETVSVTDTNDEEDFFDRYKLKPRLTSAEIYKNRKNIIAGSPVMFNGQAFDQFGKERDSLYEWNMGDGTVLLGEQVSHTYFHPGKYVVVATVRRGGIEIVKRLEVNVIDAVVSISDVEYGNDGFVEIENVSNSEINLSQWSIQSGSKIFLIPYNTFVLPGQKIRFSSRAMKIPITEDPIVRYPNSETVPLETKLEPEVLNNELIATPFVAFANAEEEKAEAQGSFIENEEEDKSIIFWIVALVVLIGVAVVSVIFLGRFDQ